MNLIKTFIVAVLLCAASFTQAQKWDFGISAGVNASILDMPQSVRDITTFKQDIGYRVGLMADRKLVPFLHFIPRVDLMFNNNLLSFKDGVTPNYDVMPMALCFSGHMRLEIEAGKRDPYLAVGPTIKFPLRKQSTPADMLKTGYDFAIDVGFGYSRNGLLFDFAPELRYSYGLRNVSKNPSIDELYLHQISLVFSIF